MRNQLMLLFYTVHVKRKRIFEYAHNVQTQIILRMRSLIRVFVLHWYIL